MATSAPHICVCVLTYKRPDGLSKLLDGIAEQQSGGLFTFSVVVVDNDSQRSAEALVTNYACRGAMPVAYHVEPEQSICRARNLAVEKAAGDFVVFVDDDEFPVRDWLLSLYRTITSSNVAGVLGPVKRHFETPPPAWLLRGGFYERPTHPTGFVIGLAEARTGNVILHKWLLEKHAPPFDTRLHRGGDTDFFRRMMELGYTFTWCNEAVVFETIPPVRWSRRFMVKRALLRGSINARSDRSPARAFAKSFAASIAYVIVLPFSILCGQHVFMNLMIRLSQHAARVLTVMGVSVVKSPYLTD